VQGLRDLHRRRGLSVRTTFIIESDGVVKALAMHDNSIGGNIKERYRKLQAAKFVRDHSGARYARQAIGPGREGP
jgi:peroxiredoxin (alkyl hydroperoxide reductase subunit C)